MTEWFLTYEGGQWIVLLRQEYDDRPIKMYWCSTLEEAMQTVERNTGRRVFIPLFLK